MCEQHELLFNNVGDHSQAFLEKEENHEWICAYRKGHGIVRRVVDACFLFRQISVLVG